MAASPNVECLCVMLESNWRMPNNTLRKLNIWNRIESSCSSYGWRCSSFCRWKRSGLQASLRWLTQAIFQMLWKTVIKRLSWISIWKDLNTGETVHSSSNSFIRLTNVETKQEIFLLLNSNGDEPLSTHFGCQCYRKGFFQSSIWKNTKWLLLLVMPLCKFQSAGLWVK